MTYDFVYQLVLSMFPGFNAIFCHQDNFRHCFRAGRKPVRNPTLASQSYIKHCFTPGGDSQMSWSTPVKLSDYPNKTPLNVKESPNCQFFISFHLWDQPRALILNKQKVSERAALTALDPCPGTDERAPLDTQHHQDSPPYHAVMRK